MLAPVVVDLGPNVGAREVQIVLEACNEAISNGVCLPGAEGGGEPPRAVAVARASDRRVLVVRIEVRLDPDDPTSSIVRELEFGRRDPLRERWRSVGLAIATLVGEGEQRAREEEAANVPDPLPEPAPAPAKPAPPEPAPAPAKPPPPAPAKPPPRPRAERRVEAPAAEPEEEEAPEEAATEPLEPPAPRVPIEYRPLFIGLGVLAGSGFGLDDGRVGGNLRAGWQARSGWQLVASLGLAGRTSEDTFTAVWASLEAGAGYRLDVSDAFSLGALVFGGVQRARFEVLAAGVSRAEVRWNPRLGLGLDARWRATQGFGLWASAEGSSAGRESRLFLLPDRDPIRSSPVDLALSGGIGWWIE
jgi:hypothetical protein